MNHLDPQMAKSRRNMASLAPKSANIDNKQGKTWPFAHVPASRSGGNARFEDYQRFP
jgi:hypothetical protein